MCFARSRRDLAAITGRSDRCINRIGSAIRTSDCSERCSHRLCFLKSERRLRRCWRRSWRRARPHKTSRQVRRRLEGVELQLPTTIGIPLGFVASELITNALKHGDGPITVRFEPDARKGFALSVENAGAPLSSDFDPADSKGLGMRIIRSFVGAFGGELCISRGEKNEGARLTVLFGAS